MARRKIVQTNNISVRRVQPTIPPIEPATILRRKINQDNLAQFVGQTPAPSVLDITTELRLNLGQSLIELRAFDGSLKEKSLIIKNFVSSIKVLVEIEKLDALDTDNMTEIELVELGKKLLSK